MLKPITFLIGVVLVFTAPLMKATPVLWTLQSTVLTQGTVSGSFIFDADTNTYSGWSIVIPFEPTPYNMVAETLTPANSLRTGPNPTAFRFEIIDNDSIDLFNLSFVDPLTNAGGTDTFRAPSFSSVGSFAQNAFNGSKDPIISGSVIGTALPEPGSGVLLIAGIAAIVAWDRSRQTAQFTAVRAVSSKEHPAR
jgi:hypothetical protein